jgi:hypothetical protein
MLSVRLLIVAMIDNTSEGSLFSLRFCSSICFWSIRDLRLTMACCRGVMLIGLAQDGIPTSANPNTMQPDYSQEVQL